MQYHLQLLRFQRFAGRGGSRGGSLGADEPPFEPTVPIIEMILGCKHSKKSGELNRRWLADAQVDGPCDGPLV